MAKMQSAERVSANDLSDNFVYQRSVLAYKRAAERVSGEVLEIGTGMGYGIEVVAPAAASYTTIDKSVPQLGELPSNVVFRQMQVPPIGFADESFDYVISFQVIEHIKADEAFVAEVARVLRRGGEFIVTTPNAPMSLTRNPWHVREYRAEELKELLERHFSQVECYGVEGNAKVMEYYEANRRSVERIARWDILDLQHRLPAWCLRLPYDVLNRINRRRLLKKNRELTSSIAMEDYRIAEVSERSFDLFFVARK